MLKLQPPAERTKTVVSGWIAGVRPGAEKGQRFVTKMINWLRKLSRRFREGFSRRRTIVDGPGAKQQFLPGSSMHTIYAEGPAPDLVSVGRIAGIDLLTQWVSTWRILYLFKVLILGTRSRRKLIRPGQTLWIPRHRVCTGDCHSYYSHIPDGDHGCHYGPWWSLGIVLPQDRAGQFFCSSNTGVFAHRAVRYPDEARYNSFSG